MPWAGLRPGPLRIRPEGAEGANWYDSPARLPQPAATMSMGVPAADGAPDQVEESSEDLQGASQPVQPAGSGPS